MMKIAICITMLIGANSLKAGTSTDAAQTSASNPIMIYDPDLVSYLPADLYKVVATLRAFFQNQGFVESNTQHRLSVLSVSQELDVYTPETVQTFKWGGKEWPLPQTGQVWLDYELSRNPTATGYYCVSMSYTKGRMLPMVEFVMRGDMAAYQKLQGDLLTLLSLPTYQTHDYGELTVDISGVNKLSAEISTEIVTKWGNVAILRNPPRSWRHWFNMELKGETLQEVDVFMGGANTIHCGVLSSDEQAIRDEFATMKAYSDFLHKTFTKARVDNELKWYFQHLDKLKQNNVPTRVAGGINVNLLINALNLMNVELANPPPDED